MSEGTKEEEDNITETSISQAISPKYGGPVDTPLDKKPILKIINNLTVLR